MIRVRVSLSSNPSAAAPACSVTEAARRRRRRFLPVLLRSDSRLDWTGVDSSTSSVSRDVTRPRSRPAQTAAAKAALSQTCSYTSRDWQPGSGREGQPEAVAAGRQKSHNLRSRCTRLAVATATSAASWPQFYSKGVVGVLFPSQGPPFHKLNKAIYFVDSPVHMKIYTHLYLM